MKKILIICASDGENLKLSEKIKNSLVAKNFEALILNLVEMDLPLFSNKAENINKAQNFLDHLHNDLASEAMIFVAPEYNGGIPPVLTNFIAWVSRMRQDWRLFFNQKPALLATHSGGGGLNLLTQLRLQLSYVGMIVLPRQIHTHFQKSLDESSLEDCLKQLIHQLD